MIAQAVNVARLENGSYEITLVPGSFLASLYGGSFKLTKEGARWGSERVSLDCKLDVDSVIK